MSQSPKAAPPARWWCNFCGFKTDDRRLYLAHSCTEVLESQGKKIPASGTERNCR